MKTKKILLLIIILIFFSCETPERNNPYDPESPKYIWTPTSFQAVQEGNSIKLNWNNPSANFEGLRITKSVNNGATIILVDLPNNVNQFVDNNLIGGQQQVYNIYAYAGNNQSNSLSAQVTPILLASVLTDSTTLIGTKSATFSGSITSNGGSQISERGFCWSLNQNPTVLDNKVINQSGLNNFNQIVLGLNSNTNYYVRAYVINNQGISYGNQQVFTTLGYGSVTDIDNNVYSTITIGTQVWMVENLKTTKYINGGSIPNVTNSWFNLQTPSYCWYNNNIAYKNTYGALYNFHAVQTGNLAPIGWHVPTDNEWSILINYLGGPLVAGNKLKEIGISHWTSPNNDATNIVGFTALPGGFKVPDGIFLNIGDWGYWWTSTTDGSSNAKYRMLAYTGVLLGENDNSSNSKNNGYSIRCVKD
jgi:uncharacterized protein (TIGR02145 family)